MLVIEVQAWRDEDSGVSEVLRTVMGFDEAVFASLSDLPASPDPDQPWTADKLRIALKEAFARALVTMPEAADERGVIVFQPSDDDAEARREGVS